MLSVLSKIGKSCSAPNKGGRAAAAVIGGVSGVAGIDGKRERRHRHRLSISKKKSFPRSCTTKEEEDLHRFQRCVRCQQTLVQLHALNSEDTFFTEQCIHLHAPAIY